jgi:hypothetical protein
MAQLVIKRCSLQMLDEYPNAHNARTHTHAHMDVQSVKLFMQCTKSTTDMEESDKNNLLTDIY